MKKTVTFLIIIISILFFLGCNKHDIIIEEPPLHIDKQLPGEYFPAFPKTWWSYRNQNNNLVMYTISDEYHPYKGKYYPVFMNINKRVQGSFLIHDFYAGLGAYVETPSSIYSVKKDTVMSCTISFSTLKFENFAPIPIYRRKTITVDTVMTVSGISYQNVIVIKETNINNTNHLYYDYFAKNVGIIRRDSANIIDTTNLIPILTLENYHIGN
jgi:hypothetical protein